MVRKSKKMPVKTEIFQTEDKDVKCTKLPEFIRAKKYLGAPFCVYFENQAHLENVKCTISAGNFKNPSAELKNNECLIKNGVAEFDDLRFLGKSGRGTKFNVYIQLETNPPRIITYHNAIKVTVDGPRPPRIGKSLAESGHVLNRFKVKPKVQEALRNSQELACLKRTLEAKECQMDKSKFFNQPLKKRFIQTYLMEEEMGSNGASSNSSEVSFNTSPSLSPNPAFVEHKPAVKSLMSCCSNLETLRLEQDSAYANQEEYFRDLISKYLILFMNLYKIKISDDLNDYLINLILSKTNGSLQDQTNWQQLNKFNDNVNFSSFLNDEQFLLNFEGFYRKLVQDFGKVNLANDCCSNY